MINDFRERPRETLAEILDWAPSARSSFSSSGRGLREIDDDRAAAKVI